MLIYYSFVKSIWRSMKLLTFQLEHDSVKNRVPSLQDFFWVLPMCHRWSSTSSYCAWAALFCKDAVCYHSAVILLVPESVCLGHGDPVGSLWALTELCNGASASLLKVWTAYLVWTATLMGWQILNDGIYIVKLYNRHSHGVCQGGIFQMNLLVYYLSVQNSNSASSVTLNWIMTFTKIVPMTLIVLK